MTDLPITYVPNFIANPDDALRALQTELEWERREDAPRSEYYTNDTGEPYTYGNGTGRRTYLVRPYHAVILDIRKELENYVATAFPSVKPVFEVCFLNRYLNQSDALGWHADASLEMDDARPIATISLGVEREIWFRPNGKENTQNITKLKLGNGSMCLMHPGMQDTHQHRIPKASFICDERISLTFRGFVH
jgi:alkylated DNA repair dioxygenase AlkB